jgi:hypothetical protein
MNLHAATGILNGIPVDWLIIILAGLLISGEALYAGSRHASALSLSIPIASLMFAAISRAAYLGQMLQKFSTPAEQAILFAIIAVIIFICTDRILSSFGNYGTPLFAVISGIAATIVLAVFWIQIPALQSVWHFGTQIQSVFGDQYRFWWLLGSYIALAFARS